MAAGSRGFDGRVFLTDDEWATYMRRLPVRYIRGKHSDVCHHCGLPATDSNPMQHCHLIPFVIGIRQYRLTPDFLDSGDNIVSAHRKGCNKAVELSEAGVREYLARCGGT